LRVVTKDLLGGRVFAAPRTLSSSRPNALVAEADAPPLVTDAAEMPNGDYLVRNYATAYLYTRDGSLVESFDLPDQPQGESMAVVEHGRAVMVGSEGRSSQVLRVPVPTVTAPEPLPSGTPSPAPPSSSRVATRPATADDPLHGVVRTLTVVAVAAAGLLGLVALGGLVMMAKERRR
jgi:hypothetical protein